MEPTAPPNPSAPQTILAAEGPTPRTTDQYHALFHSMDQGFCVLELQFDDTGEHVVDFRYQQLNPMFSQQSGIPEGALGKTSRELMPDLEPFWFDTYGRVALTGESARLEHYVPQVGRWFDVHAFRVGAAETRQVGVLFTDITARKQTVAADAFRLQTADALAPLADPVAVQETVTRLARQHFQADRCYYVEIEGDQGIIRRDASADGLPLLACTYPMATYVLLQAVIEAGRPFCVRDVRADESVDEGLRQLCAQLQVVSYLIVPVMKNGQAVGVLCLVQRVPRDWTTPEATLAADVAERTWAAVERARAEEALARSEEKYRSLFNSIDEGFAISELLYDAQGRPVDARLLETNASYDRITQTMGAAGRRVKEVFPTGESAWFEAYAQVVETGKNLRFESYSAALDRWITMYASRVGSPNSRYFATVFNDVTERKRHEHHAAFLDELSQALAMLDGPDEIVRATGELLGTYLGVGFLNVVDVALAAGDEPAEARFTVASTWEREGLPSPRGTYRAGDYLSPEFLRAAHAGEPIVIRNTDTDPRVDAAAYRALGMQAFVAVPVLNAQGAWPGLISAFTPSPRDWRPDEVKLLVEVGHRVFPRIERTRAEEALRVSEAKYRTLFETMDQGFGVGEVLPAGPGRPVDFRWLEVNPQVERLTGMPQAALLSGETMRVVMPQLEDILYEQYERVASTGKAIRIEQYAQVLDRWFDVYAYALDLAGSVPHRVALLFTNITARKQAEETLRRAEERHRQELEQQVTARTQELRESRRLLQTVFDASPTAIVVMRLLRDVAEQVEDFEIVITNAFNKQVTGRDDLVGRRFTAMFPQTVPTGILARLLAVATTGEPADFEQWYEGEGMQHWFRHIVVRQDGLLVLTSEVITARKQAEHERTRNLRLLEQAETAAGLGSWDYDLLSGQFLWSEGMYQLFGLPLGQAIEPHVYLDFVVDEDRPRAEQFVRCLTTGCADFEETLRLRVDAQVKTVRLKVVVLHDEAGQPVRTLGVDLDISQLQRLEADNLRLRLTQQQALFEAVQAAQEQERKRMAESLHNGIGQTLYATKLRLDQLDAPLLDTNDPALVTARNEAKRLLSEAIRQTRALSHELVPMALEKFGLTTALQDIGNSMSTPQLRLRCQVQLDEDAGPLAPPLQIALYRMAQELALNIVKHARGATAASLELETMPGWALLRAEDNGAGFAALPADSAGLGLRSIRDRVALLGGQLETGAVPAGGAYVRIRLPIPSFPAP